MTLPLMETIDLSTRSPADMPAIIAALHAADADPNVAIWWEYEDSTLVYRISAEPERLAAFYRVIRP